MIKPNGWEERMELARRRCSEVIDLDQEPPVKYISMRCETALKELDELDKLHHQAILSAEERKVREIKEFVNKETLMGGPAYSNFLNREWVGKRDVIGFLDSLSLPDQEQLKTKEKK